MIPLRHTLPSRTTPVVNRAIVIANGIVFVAQLFLGQRTEVLINIFGFVPARLVHPAAYGYSTFEVAVTLITSLFLHGGFVHLIGNMIYLWVFGGAVEDALGHLRYLAFFLVCGVIGSLTHTMLFPQSTVPSIGASGSIAGILGAFLVLRPRARITHLSARGDDPVLMLTAPIPATAHALKSTGLTLDDIDLIEINEAFASVVLAWQRETGADLDRVNVSGGAIALGHPLGATGARLLTTLIHNLERTGGRRGLVTMCEGGGQANVTIIERL